MKQHAFDAAMRLDEIAPGRYAGHTSADYWNMVGPFGGTTAATALQAVLRHPQLLGAPLSLTVNYAGALTQGPFEVQLQPVRTNRSTQHWTIGILQKDEQGNPVVTTTATVVTAVRRETWSLSDTPMPHVPAPHEAAALHLAKAVAWFHCYEMRPVSGAIPQQWDGHGETSLSQL
jgi:acyl-CoA thioesterase